MKKFLLIFLFSLFVLSIPFSFSIASNQVKLWRFAQQLDKVDRLLIDFQLLAEGRHLEVGGNSASITFSATKIYRRFIPEKNKMALKAQIEAIKFNPAGERADGADAELYIFFSGSILGITIQDGPASAGLDFRFW